MRMPSLPESPRARWMGMTFALCAAVLALHASSYLPFFADDAFISLRYADRLLHGQGLTWTDGDRVEGYSNLLWIVGCTALGAVHVDLVLAARVLGVATALAAMTALARYVPRDLPAPRAALVFAAGAFAWASSGPVAVWSIGGLEQPLVAALLLWGLVQVDAVASETRSWHALLRAGIPLGILAWTRPDGALFGILIAGAIGLLQWKEGAPPRSVARLVASIAAFPLAFAIVQLLFRLAYYGAWVPNPALVKLSFTFERMSEGWTYVASSLSAHINIVLLAASATFPFLHDRQARKRIVVLFLLLAGWLGYVVVVGGDIFPARRHFVPAISLMCLLVIEGMVWAARRSLPWRAVAGAMAVITLLAGMLRQTGDRALHRALEERWEWLGEPVGHLLARHFGPAHVLLATDTAGALPYFSRLPAIDLLGLNDRVIAHHRPADFGRGPLGHELGDGFYVLSRRPDLIIFGLPTGAERALYRSGVQMQADPQFFSQYALVTFEANGDRTVRARVWVRREGRTGVQTSEGLLRIPGYLLATAPNVVAREDGEGRLGAVVTPLGSGLARARELSAGHWVVRADFSGPTPRIAVACSDRELASGPPDTEFSVWGDCMGGVTVKVSSVGAALDHIREIRLQRLSD
jgi:arabinofuranosyltransferase